LANNEAAHKIEQSLNPYPANVENIASS